MLMQAQPDEKCPRVEAVIQRSGSIGAIAMAKNTGHSIEAVGPDAIAGPESDSDPETSVNVAIPPNAKSCDRVHGTCRLWQRRHGYSEQDAAETGLRKNFPAAITRPRESPSRIC